MSASKRLDWTSRAEREYLQALVFIATESGARNATLVMQRVERAESLLAAQPEIGTPGRRSGTREYPVAHTGHTLVYRITSRRIQILRFLHQRMDYR
ncbi:MAG: type II toxin-antitoxin system RelE/ParE family toxin [Sulfurisoma sp.]|nr:type II toxin-antitoxin system RelE/ParE family toxin [Sulfurisoma sp.]